MVESDIAGLLSRGFESKSAEDTLALASAYAKTLKPDAFIALSGDLGAGKTAFAKGLAAGLGVEGAVKSPSFNVCSIYEASKGVKFVHIDAYRLSGAEAFEDLLIDEIAPSPKIVCVEWPEMAGEAIPDNAVKIRLEILQNGSHFIKFYD